MHKKFMRRVILLLAAVMIISCGSLTYAGTSEGTVVESGSCGTNLTWELSNNGTLSISGTGDMDYYGSNPPWRFHKTNIETVSIENGVTSIGWCAFEECKNLTTVTIPDSVTFIDEDAFSHCENLTSVEIPDGVTYIGSDAFSYCGNLTSVEISDSVTSIESGAFFNCTALTSITIPDGVTTIYGSTFAYCTALASVTIPDSVTSIEKYSFLNCKNLTIYGNAGSYAHWYAEDHYITFKCLEHTCSDWIIDDPGTCIKNGSKHGICVDCGETVKDVIEASHTIVTSPAKAPTCTENGYTESKYCSVCGYVEMYGAVIHTSGHQWETFPAVEPTCTESGLTEGKSCSKCGEISKKQEVLPAQHKKVTEAYVQATYSKPGLTEGSHCSACGMVLVEQKIIPAKGDKGTSGKCGSNLSWAISADGVLTISGTGSMNNYHFSLYEYPNYQGEAEFCEDWCDAPWYFHREKIKKVIIQSGVTTIGEEAFTGLCNLTEVVLPVGLSEIGRGAFYSCYSLKTISLPEGLTEVEDEIFMDCSSLETICIPKGVTSIGFAAFLYCDNLKNVVYGDTKTQWHRIYIEGDNESLIRATISCVEEKKKVGKVALSTSTYVYNSKVKSPKIIVKDSKGKTISSKYYTVSKPSGRKNIGKYTYTIKFKGAYSDNKAKKLILTIKPAKTTIKAPKAAKKDITVKWTKGKSSQVSGYEILLATNNKFTKNKKTVTVKGVNITSKKVTKLKIKTKYFVKVRTYKTVKGVKIYSDWSKVKTCKTK